MKYIVIACTLFPSIISAMQNNERLTNTVTRTATRSDEDMMIHVMASFFSPSENKQKTFSRFLALQYLQCDQYGNVDIIDQLNISIKTNKLPPMFGVTLKALGVNTRTNQMKLECITSDEYAPEHTETLKLLLPANTKYTETRSLTLTDDTQQPISLSIETWPSIHNMNQGNS